MRRVKKHFYVQDKRVPCHYSGVPKLQHHFRSHINQTFLRRREMRNCERETGTEKTAALPEGQPANPSAHRSLLTTSCHPARASERGLASGDEASSRRQQQVHEWACLSQDENLKTKYWVKETSCCSSFRMPTKQSKRFLKINRHCQQFKESTNTSICCELDISIAVSNAPTNSNKRKARWTKSSNTKPCKNQLFYFPIRIHVLWPNDRFNLPLQNAGFIIVRFFKKRLPQLWCTGG